MQHKTLIKKNQKKILIFAKALLVYFLLPIFLWGPVMYFRNLPVEIYFSILWAGVIGTLSLFYSINKKTIYLAIGVLIMGLCTIEWYHFSITCWGYIKSNFPINNNPFINDPFNIDGYFAISIRIMSILLAVPIWIICMNFFLGILRQICGSEKGRF